MDPIKGRDPIAQKLMGQRADAVLKQREQLLQKQNPTVTNHPDGSQTLKVTGQLKDEAAISKATSQAASASVSPSAVRAKTGSLADRILTETVNKPFEEGIISEDTRDDLIKMVAEGTMGRDAATYLASSVDNLGGDVMVKIAADLCRQDPTKFKQDFQAGDLYKTLVEEHHNRYYPKQDEASVQGPESQTQPLPDINGEPSDTIPEKPEEPSLRPADEKPASQANAPEPQEKPLPEDGSIKEAINKPFEDGLISEKTRDDLLGAVQDGKMSPEIANYLASNVNEIGGDVMVNIALDICKEDPAKFKQEVQSDGLYQTLAAEHHRRYYPSEQE